ncbi:hypothetical protein ACWKWC_01300 [Geodermatophilus nigrescens]
MARYSTTLSRAGGPPAPSRRRRRRLLGMMTGFVGAAVITGGVAAALLQATANNPTPQPVTTSRVSLTLSDNGAGFSQAVSGLLPADTVQRFVQLTNGSADAQNLTVAVSANSATRLSTDATYGLQVAVTGCSVAWTAGSNTCSGTTTPLVASTPLAGFGSRTLVAGAVAANSVQHLRVTLSLPDQVETTTNGTLPANTIQSLSTTLTYTFAVTQRPGVSSTG